MSDMLQLVVVMPSDQPDRNARPPVDLTPFELSAGDVDDKLKKHIGHSWREVRRPAMWSSSADLNEVNP